MHGRSLTSDIARSEPLTGRHTVRGAGSGRPAAVAVPRRNRHLQSVDHRAFLRVSKTHHSRHRAFWAKSGGSRAARFTRTQFPQRRPAVQSGEFCNRRQCQPNQRRARVSPPGRSVAWQTRGPIRTLGSARSEALGARWEIRSRPPASRDDERLYSRRVRRYATQGVRRGRWQCRCSVEWDLPHYEGCTRTAFRSDASPSRFMRHATSELEVVTEIDRTPALSTRFLEIVLHRMCEDSAYLSAFARLRRERATARQPSPQG
jgi:hypothetical protein